MARATNRDPARLRRGIRELLVVGIVFGFTCAIFAAFQLLATVLRLLFNPAVFEVRGTYGYLDIPFYLVGDALAMADFVAVIHAVLVALGYGVWLARQNLKRDQERRAGEDFCVVPKTLYGSILGFCAFGAFGTAVHLPYGDFDLIAGAIYVLMPILAPLGLVIGWRATLRMDDGSHPNETELLRVFVQWTAIAIGLGLAVHSIVFWLH